MPATYAWIIDRDYTHDPDLSYSRDDTGTCGPWDAPHDLLAQLRTTKNGDPFHMYDDDGERYYDGRLLWTADADADVAFGPLDDFGTPNAGASEIRYRDPSTGTWAAL